jgi:chaperonin GroES
MIPKEQSSILTQKVPKIKLPNNDLVGVTKSEPKKEIPTESTQLPQPTGWRILVLPFKMKEKTDKGIYLGQETVERQQVASQCGNVLAMGSECYQDKKRYSSGPWCKIGDWVVFARYAGSRIEIEGGEVRLLNEDEVLATIQDPKSILHKY